MSIALPTTSAPNRPLPSSGSELVGAPACTNCAAALGGPYCAQCGQRDVPHNPSARVLVGELWDTFGTVDGKLVRTVALLVARPGALTVEWLRGRRAPYLRPINVYLTMSAAYFAVLGTTFNPQTLQASRSAAERASTAEFRARVERKYGHAPAPQRVLLTGIARFGADPAEGFRVVIPEFPRLMFVLVPLFALLVQLTVRRRAWRYPAHLYFALHVFSFYFAASLVDRAAQVYGPLWLHSAANRALALGTLVYMALAMRRVYGGRWWVTAVRITAITIPFLTVATLCLVGLGIFLLGTR